VVRRNLSQVRAGTGRVVVVEGTAGLGKTRLLDECVSMAGELSFRVGRGATDPGRVIELGALFDALFEGDPPLADRRALNDVHASSEFLFWLLQDVQSLIEEAVSSAARAMREPGSRTCSGHGFSPRPTGTKTRFRP
jgi:predicted ATPase